MVKCTLNHLVLGMVLLACLIGDITILIRSAAAAAPKILTTTDPSQIPLDDAVIMGNRDAPYRFIIFQDPDCLYCLKMHREIRKLTDATQDIVFYIKMYPLRNHRKAYEKSHVITCEKSLKILEDAFEHKQLPSAKCDTLALDQSIEFAKKLGLSGVPALILPDGRVALGFQNVEAILSMIGFNYEKVEDNLNFFSRRDNARKKVVDYLALQATNLEDAALLKAAQTNAPEAYRAFLANYPNSKYRGEVENYVNWHRNAKVAISASLNSDTQAVQAEQISNRVAKLNSPFVYVPNLSELEANERGDGALAIVTHQMIKNSQSSTATNPALLLGAGNRPFRIVDVVVASFTGVIVDALLNALKQSGNSDMEWTVLITSPNSGRNIEGAKYKRAFFSNSLDNLFNDERFDRYIQETVLLSWLAKQPSVSDSFYNVLLQRGDGVFACAAMNASYHFKKILSESELTDYCQISLLRNVMRDVPVPAK